MNNDNLTTNIDNLLDFVSRISWVIFIVFVIIYFLQTLINQGLNRAFARLFSIQVLVPLLVVIVISLLSLAIVFVQPQRVGVVISLIAQGGVRQQPIRPGLNWIVPLIEEVKFYPTFWQTYTMANKPNEGEVLGDDSIISRTKDGQEVRLDCSIIFRVNVNQAVRIHVDWQNRYVNDLVRPVVRGIVRRQVSQFTADEVNSEKRKDLEIDLDRTLRESFDEKGLTLDQFLLRNIAFTQEYAEAIEQKQVAFEGIQRREYERQQRLLQALANADQIRIESVEQARALDRLGRALMVNPDLVTYTYIDKIAPNIRVMLVPSNNPLILPLPELDEQTLITPTQSFTLSTTPSFSPNNSIGISY